MRATLRRIRSVAVVFGAVAFVAPLSVRGDEDETAKLETALDELAHVVRDIGSNLGEQEKAWPTREEDLLAEKPPPIAVRKLQDDLRELVERKRLLLLRVKVATQADREVLRLAGERPPEIGPFVDLLERTREPDDLKLVETLLPIATSLGRREPEVARALLDLAARFDPPPDSVVHALGNLGDREASLWLLDLGARTKRMVVLRAAGTSGDAQAVRRLIDLAEGKDRELAKAALDAITRLTPPDSVDRSDLRSAVARRAENARSERLKAALVTYLGLLRNDSNVPFFQGMYARAKNDTVRIAAIGALGNAGEKGGEFVLGQLRAPQSSLQLRRSCIHALGAIGHRPAVPVLIPLLDEPQFEHEARRALQRIAGDNLGLARGPWMRWWRQQPDADETVRDPDAE